mgnify:FL=1
MLFILDGVCTGLWLCAKPVLGWGEDEIGITDYDTDIISLSVGKNSQCVHGEGCNEAC